jgi:hypothetical protein
VYTNPESTQLIASDIVDIEDFTKWFIWNLYIME